MNKNEFIAAVADSKALANMDMSKAAVATVIDSVFDVIENALKKGDEVRLVGFGNFVDADTIAIGNLRQGFACVNRMHFSLCT